MNLDIDQSNNPTIIGICGHKGHGKDSLADILVKDHGYIKIAFADALREAILILTNKSEEIFDIENKDRPIELDGSATPRDYLIAIATAAKKQDPDVFVKSIERKIKSYIIADPNVKIVISDIRFFNELAFVLSLGGCIFHIERTELYSRSLGRLSNVLCNIVNTYPQFTGAALFLIQIYFLFNPEERKQYGDHTEIQAFLYKSRYCSHFSVVNDGTLEDLRKGINTLMISECCP